MIKHGEENGKAVDRPALTFEELAKLKVLNQEQMDAIRANWRAEACAMSSEKREQAAERFRLAFERIASQFGKSRAFTQDEPG